MTGCGATAAVVVTWLPACAGHQEAATAAVKATGEPVTVVPVCAMPCTAGRAYPVGGQQ